MRTQSSNDTVVRSRQKKRRFISREDSNAESIFCSIYIFPCRHFFSLMLYVCLLFYDLIRDKSGKNTVVSFFTTPQSHKKKVRWWKRCKTETGRSNKVSEMIHISWIFLEEHSRVGSASRHAQYFFLVVSSLMSMSIFKWNRNIFNDGSKKRNGTSKNLFHFSFLSFWRRCFVLCLMNLLLSIPSFIIFSC